MVTEMIRSPDPADPRLSCTLHAFRLRSSSRRTGTRNPGGPIQTSRSPSFRQRHEFRAHLIRLGANKGPGPRMREHRDLLSATGPDQNAPRGSVRGDDTTP